jgi:hypothetical protein
MACSLLWPGPAWSDPPVPHNDPVTGQQPHAARFRVFDGTTFRYKPRLAQYGMEPVNLVYEGSLFNEHASPQSMPSIIDIKRVALSAKTAKGITIIDVERWLWLPDGAHRYAELMQRMKEINPEIKTGYYSIVPKRDYWRAKENPGSKEYREWQRENDQLQPVADNVDYLFPSLYTFYDYQPGWVAYAEANIAEARRLAKGKPVYVFLWPSYHESNAQLKGKPIPADFWRLQLETAKRLADGVVIWGGSKWDPEAPWWSETRKFLESLKDKE